MRLFFGASALVKFFHEEDGSENVTELMTSSWQMDDILSFRPYPFEIVHIKGQQTISA